MQTQPEIFTKLLKSLD